MGNIISKVFKRIKYTKKKKNVTLYTYPQDCLILDEVNKRYNHLENDGRES